MIETEAKIRVYEVDGDEAGTMGKRVCLSAHYINSRLLNIKVPPCKNSITVAIDELSKAIDSIRTTR